jgi:hypothetical protein
MTGRTHELQRRPKGYLGTRDHQSPPFRALAVQRLCVSTARPAACSDDPFYAITPMKARAGGASVADASSAAWSQSAPVARLTQRPRECALRSAAVPVHRPLRRRHDAKDHPRRLAHGRAARASSCSDANVDGPDVEGETSGCSHSKIGLSDVRGRTNQPQALPSLQSLVAMVENPICGPSAWSAEHCGSAANARGSALSATDAVDSCKRLLGCAWKMGSPLRGCCSRRHRSSCDAWRRSKVTQSTVWGSSTGLSCPMESGARHKS